MKWKILLFITAVLFIGCNSNDVNVDKHVDTDYPDEPIVYPIDIELKDYSLSESEVLENLKPDSVYIINSVEEFSKYFAGNPEIDFEKYSLIVTWEKVSWDIYEKNIRLIQKEDDEFELKINVLLGDEKIGNIYFPENNWVVSILIPKLNDHANLTFNFSSINYKLALLTSEDTSIWKFYNGCPNGDCIITMFTFYSAEKKLHFISDPLTLGECWAFSGENTYEFIILNNSMYLKAPPEFDPNHVSGSYYHGIYYALPWRISCFSEIEMYFMHDLKYYNSYTLVLQINFN